MTAQAQAVKQFSRQITLAELTLLSIQKGWTLDTLKHDLEGSDWVSLYWKHGGKVRPVLYSPWNGHFIAQMDDGTHITERSPDGAAPWLDDLLEVLFTNKPRT